MPALAAASALLLTLTACVPPADVVVPVEPSHAQPVFASDEEALAAAVEVYVEYERVTNEIGQAPTDDFDAMRGLTTEEWFEAEVESLTELFESGRRFSGSSVVKDSSLQQWWEDPIGVANVIVYLCVDITHARLLDSDGLDITPEDRVELVPLEVLLVSDESSSTKLVIAKVSPWVGSGLCS